MKHKNPLMTPAQRKHLEGRVTSHGYTLRGYGRLGLKRDKPKEPPKVKAARALVRSYDARLQKIENHRDMRIEKATKRAEHAILFGTPTQASAAVEQFEKMIF